MQLTKIEAASRQLNMAIELLFEGRDSVAIHTLVGAAGRILSDLVEHRRPGESWRSKTVESLPGISVQEGYAILNRTPNFLKHADRDPDGVESFNEEENDDLMFLACLECGEIEIPLSLQMQAFQIWYMAAYPERFGSKDGPWKTAVEVLPTLAQLDRSGKLALGAQFLEDQRKEPEIAV